MDIRNVNNDDDELVDMIPADTLTVSITNNDENEIHQYHHPTNDINNIQQLKNQLINNNQSFIGTKNRLKKYLVTTRTIKFI